MTVLARKVFADAGASPRGRGRRVLATPIGADRDLEWGVLAGDGEIELTAPELFVDRIVEVGSSGKWIERATARPRDPSRSG